MTYTEAQNDAITLNGNLVVTAGAGSGKTRVLVARYLRLLDPDALTDILAITFTDKAAREMRERVRAATEAQARAATDPATRERWEDLRARVEAARIGTIHAFCAALLRAHPAESGLDPRFDVLDEVEQALLLDESINAALQQVAASGAAPEATDMQALQEAFSLDELRALLHGMVAGGSEVAAAVAALPALPADLLALWQSRLEAARAEVRNELLSSAAWRSAADTLRSLAPAATAADLIGKQVLAVAEWLPMLEHAPPGSLPDCAPVESIKLTGGSKKNWPTAADLAAAKDALRALRDSFKAQASLLTVQPDAALEERAAQFVPALCRLYQRASTAYRRRKEQRDALDFDDLEQRARHLLEQHPAVRARWQAEFHAVLVDEFQDTNDEQRAIIYALAGAGEPAPADGAPLPTLFVVGDGKQSIYRFRGADVSVFRRVAADIQAQGGQVVALDTSFRTHPPLLEWINTVSRGIFAREHALRPYEIPFEPLGAHRPPPPHSRCVELHLISGAGTAAQTRAEEGCVLAERLRALVNGSAGPLVYDTGDKAWRTPRYSDIAILCQASTVFGYYEAALREADIPYLTTAGRGYYGRNEVQDLIHLVRVLSDPTDELALVGVLRSPLFALSDATILRLRFAHPHSLWAALLASDEQHAAPDDAPALAFARDTLRDLAALRGHLTVVELLRAALARTGYLATVSGLEHGSQRRVNIEKLLEAARQAGRSGLPDFSAHLESLLKTEPREGEAPLEAGDSVRLMTVHKSKGLEFPIVVLPDLGRRGPRSSPRWLARRSYGLALRLRDEHGEEQEPIAYHLARREEQQMEAAERDRLLYVALTRASDYLILSGATATQSGPDWLSRLLGALGTPWEEGGPPAGSAGALEVWHHASEPPEA